MTRDPAPDSERWARICAVIDAVLEAPRDQRARILDERCRDDPALRAEVEALLRHADDDTDELETPLVERMAGSMADGMAHDADADPPAEGRIGPWRLVEPIGRGGMGTVWLAERIGGDFEQRVALKLLKRGMDSDAILLRFAAERRILARLSHPGIARLIDGGIADDGRPWFAMELIDGEPITRWCDARRLPVRERLRLFLDVLEAVQYAHGQLVVHRDLKPSNILVSAQGQVKLLDFGIARLLDADSANADPATLTQLGMRMLTPAYAAPEQVRGEAVGTSADVYALGVLLFELLAGQRPFADAERRPVPVDLPGATPPPRPSTRIARAELRSTSPERLRRALRGDLDTITVRALQPEPARRYATAEALAEDIRRHLDGRPVEARPDSAWYRIRKFAARNRVAVAAAALIVASLAGGMMLALWQANEARQQAARAEQVKTFLTRIFEAGGTQEWRGSEPTARELLDAGARRVEEELRDQPELHSEMLAVIGSLYREQGQLDRAEDLLKRSLEERRRLFGEQHEAYADSLYRWSLLARAKGDWDDAGASAEQATKILRDRLGDDPRTALAIGSLSDARLESGDMDEAITLRNEALEMHRRVSGQLHRNVSDGLRALAALYVESGKLDEAAEPIEESLRIEKILYGNRSKRYADARSQQARLLYKLGKTGAAADAYRESANVYHLAGDPARYEDALNHYGVALCRMGRYVEAESTLRSSVDVIKQNLHSGNQWVGSRLVSLGECLVEAGHPADAELAIREGLGIIESAVGSEHAWTAYARGALAKSLTAQGKHEKALPLATSAYEQFRKQYGEDNAMTADALRTVATARFSAGQRSAGLLDARRAWESLRKAHGDDFPATAIAALNLASLELYSGGTADAVRQLSGAEKVFKAIGDLPRESTARMLRGSALTVSNRPHEAKPLLEGALDERRRLYGEDNMKTEEARIHLALNAAVGGQDGGENSRKTLAAMAADYSMRFGGDHEVVRFVDRFLAAP